jgi:hypothetical protein
MAVWIWAIISSAIAEEKPILLASFGPATTVITDISNTWLVPGYLSSSPTCPAPQSVSEDMCLMMSEWS